MLFMGPMGSPRDFGLARRFLHPLVVFLDLTENASPLLTCSRNALHYRGCSFFFTGLIEIARD